MARIICYKNVLALGIFILCDIRFFLHLCSKHLQYSTYSSNLMLKRFATVEMVVHLYVEKKLFKINLSIPKG